MMLSLWGCFPKDEAYPLKPYEGFAGIINQSIYDYQSFYSLSGNIVTNSNSISTWDLGFNNSANGGHIILNTGDLLTIANLGIVNFENTEIPNDAYWTYDASSGNLDSLAINGWVNVDQSPYTYSNNVYVIAKADVPFKKFKIIELSNTSYTIIISSLEIFEPDTVFIEKDDLTNYTKLSIQNENKVAVVEPKKTDWDYQFTSYQTIILDDDGTPTPYLVRGVLLNPNYTEVSLQYITDEMVAARPPEEQEAEEDELEDYFIKLKADDLSPILYTSVLDAIGYDWKEVTIDYESNSAVYKTDLRKVFIVKTHRGEVYKLRFISYYNGGIKGYPKFQYAILE